jgi:hypothetical protein
MLMAKTVYATVVLAVIAVLMLSGCAQLLPPGWNATTDSPTAAVGAEIEETQEDISVIEEADEVVDVPVEEAPEETAPAEAEPAPVEASPEETEAEPVEAAPAEEAAPIEAAPVEDANLPKKAVVEGDLVSFPNLKATDPDGDPIIYTFTPPLDAAGKWQTKIGDAGDYKVTITASDGKNSVSQMVVIQVKPKNLPPVLQLSSKQVNIKEGETVTLNVQASDPDGDKVSISFDGWMNGPAKTTGYEDAGNHEVTVIASDGKTTVRDTVRVIVENFNRAPSVSAIGDITVKEGDKITVKPTAMDPDGEKVSFVFSSPLGPDGTWLTTSKDVGRYTVNVTATDGQLSASTSFAVTVQSLNKQPVIQMSDTLNVDEGQTVTLTPVITDPEGDELTITYSGWMKSNTYTTAYEDSGTHLVTITVSDGINTAKKDVTVVVNDVNRAPTFGQGAFI